MRCAYHIGKQIRPVGFALFIEHMVIAVGFVVTYINVIFVIRVGRIFFVDRCTLRKCFFAPSRQGG